MPGNTETTLSQPVRRMYQERLGYAFSVIFLVLNMVFSVRYVHCHLLACILGYWLSRVRGFTFSRCQSSVIVTASCASFLLCPVSPVFFLLLSF